MSTNTRRRWFTAKDINNHLDITRSQLYHWTRVWKLVAPGIKAGSRAHKDKYSFVSLLDLALIKELDRIGFEPSHINKFINPFPESSDADEEWKGSIWKFYKDGREDCEDMDDDKEGFYTVQGFDKAGFLILIFMHEEKYKSFRGTNNQVLSFIKDFNLTDNNKGDSTSLLIINMSKIVKELEKETGETL